MSGLNDLPKDDLYPLVLSTALVTAVRDLLPDLDLRCLYTANTPRYVGEEESMRTWRLHTIGVDADQTSTLIFADAQTLTHLERLSIGLKSGKHANWSVVPDNYRSDLEYAAHVGRWLGVAVRAARLYPFRQNH